MHRSVRRPIAWVGLVVGGAVLAALVAFLFGLVVMLLWNWLMPELFGLRALSYWQAWGLVLLAHILFKAGGHGGWGNGRDRHDESWKERFRERFRKRFVTAEGASGSEPASGGDEAPSGGGGAEQPV
jgi:hypothetical protein